MITSEKNNLIDTLLKIGDKHMNATELAIKIIENSSVSNINTNFDNESELIGKLIDNLANISNLAFELKQQLENKEKENG